MSYTFVKIKEELFKDKEIKQFILDNNLTDQDIINNLNPLFSQKENNAICSITEDGCLSDPAGMRTFLKISNKKVSLTYYQYKNVNVESNLERLFFPIQEDIGKKKKYDNENREQINSEIKRVIREYKAHKICKGIYLNGPFGAGKSFLMQRLALMIAQSGAKVIITYYPDLVRHIKSSITTRETEVIINKLKNVDLLILDDIGAETNTNFIRDEVLGPILQYRIDANLPVCMTSNLTLDQLKEHFSDSKDGINVINAERIISRIRKLMKEVVLIDKNYRDFEDKI